MNGFHCVLHAAPTERSVTQAIAIGNESVQALALPGIETRFRCGFEDAAAELESLPRFFFEPDGSFVWVSERNGKRYQLDGSLYDDGKRLLNVELKGTCDELFLNQFLTCLGWPEQELVFQLVQHGVYLTEAEFRKHYVS